MDVLRWLARYIPVDPNPDGGLWIFRLPERARWMNAVFVYHDNYYIQGPMMGMKLSDIDWRVFKSLTILAETEPDLIKRCHRARDICRYWPIMRTAGHILYDRGQP